MPRRSKGYRRAATAPSLDLQPVPVALDVFDVIAAMSFGSLDDAISYIRPLVADTTKPTRYRARLLWAGAKRVRDIAGAAATLDAFMALAVDAQLISDYDCAWLGADVRDSERRFGAQDVKHILDWALRGNNPFDDQ
ncbi:MAG: hypothetical protein C0480_01185 [Bradyrhizobium sp.]|nr:hypothetical protein [Bradyrhizobium sp.]